MPKRSRTHQLEDESWKALDSCIPSEWVLRKPTSDYGIDGEIEIFDESGISTGLLCFIQLKGTDQKDRSKALKHRFKIETIGYYRSLKIPVLLIKYLSSSKELFFKWANEVDPYYSRKGSKTIGITFIEKNQFEKIESSQIVEQLKIFRELSSPKIQLPVDFFITLNSESVFGISKGLISSYLIQATDELSSILSLNFQSSQLLVPKIVITEELISVDIVGLSSFNLHTPTSLYDKKNINKLCHDIIIGIAIAFNRLGQSNIATDLAFDHVLESNLLENADKLLPLVFEIVSCFVQGRRIDLAMELAENILENHKDKDLFLIFSLPAFQKSEMTKLEFRKFKNLLKRAIKKAKEEGYIKQAGACCYNLGNKLRGSAPNSDKEAFLYYRKALKYDPTYKQRDYFWSEFAGILFHLGKFRSSEHFYGKAYALNSNTQLLALRADALMFGGEYKSALKLLNKYDSELNEYDSEWALKRWFLKGLIKTIKQDRQKRLSKEAFKLVENINVEAEIDIDVINEAIDLDGLCSLAWYKQGFYYSTKKDYDSAFNSFLISGITNTGSIDSWANALLCFFNGVDAINMIHAIFAVAYRVNGEEFIQHFSDKLEEQTQMPESVKSKIINTFHEYCREIKKDKEKPILRFINEDGSYSILDGSEENK